MVTPLLDATDSLRAHQAEALSRMHDGCVLRGGVGSGKSRTAIAYWLTNHSQEDLVIITPAVKRDSLEWDAELAAMGVVEKDHVTIDSWNRIGHYVESRGKFFILDEQRLVSRGAWVKSFLKIAKHSKWILLTATPGDKWLDYAPVFIANGYYRNFTDFNSQHVIFSRWTRYPKVERYVSVGKLTAIRNRVLVDMPMTRDTVRNDIAIPVGYDKALYDQGVKERYDYLRDEMLLSPSALAMYMRRVVNMSRDRYDQVLRLANRHKRLIVFYSFDYELDILRSLEKEGFVVTERNGHKHQNISSARKWIHLVQYTSGSEAWNCVSTDAMVFYSQQYSWRILEQSKGRIDRLNTPFKDLWYYHLVSGAPIDKAISHALKSKKDFNEASFMQKMGV